MSNSKTRRVVVSVPKVETRDGKTYRSGQAATLPDVEARDLIRAGRAREVTTAVTPTTQKKGA